MMEKTKIWIEIRKDETKEWLNRKLQPFKDFIWLKCCVPLLDRYDTGPKAPKSVTNDGVENIPNGSQSQFDAYRNSKKLLFKRMGFGAIGMCIIIIFLSWFQVYIPAKHREFWSTDYRCNAGFPIWLNKCKDVDECASKIRYCGRLQCTNTIGTYLCGCRGGFKTMKSGDADVCVDIDECAAQNTCPDKAVCQNTDGSFNCLCDTGFEGWALILGEF